MRALIITAAILGTGAAHAAGTAKVTLGPDAWTLPVIACAGGPDGFSLKAKAPEGLVELAASGGTVGTVGFRAGDMLAQVADAGGAFDGRTYRFDGEAQVFTTNAIQRRKMTVTATCG